MGGGGGVGECIVDNYPSFLLIKDMPNCIGGDLFGTLINRMIMMDEPMPMLCLGPSETEEKLINIYTSGLPATFPRHFVSSVFPAF